MGGVSMGGEGKWRVWKTANMVDVICICIWNRTMKSFAVVLGGARRGVRKRDSEGEPNQYTM
jgi:hypothetical protein